VSALQSDISDGACGGGADALAQCDVNTCGSVVLKTHSRNCFHIFYQNVRGLRTKQFKCYDSVSSKNYKVICLSGK